MRDSSISERPQLIRHKDSIDESSTDGMADCLTQTVLRVQKCVAISMLSRAEGHGFDSRGWPAGRPAISRKVSVVSFLLGRGMHAEVDNRT